MTVFPDMSGLAVCLYEMVLSQYVLLQPVIFAIFLLLHPTVNVNGLAKMNRIIRILVNSVIMVHAVLL